MRTSFFLALPLIGAWACTVSVQSGSPPPPADDGGTDAPLPTDDGGAEAAPPGYPAFLPELPQVVNLKGGVLTAPKIVTVTWTTDTNAATYDALGDAIGGTSYWTATTSEYGVGPATSGPHVHISTTPPTTMADTELDTFIETQVGGAPGNGWPVGDAQTAYLVYLPTSLVLTTMGQNACPVEAGYHDETSNAGIVYGVVIQNCHASQSVLDFSTQTATHELVEIATDPHVQTMPGWIGLDRDHYAWDMWLQNQDELADACQSFDDSYYTEQAPLAYSVQRTWSNAAAKAGHNPCAPRATDPYFQTTPLGLDSMVSFKDTNGTPVTTKGYAVKVGTPRTIQLGFTSDAPVGPWTISVVEGDGITPVTTSHVTLSPKKLMGQNGDTTDVDITVNATGANLVTVISTFDVFTRYMPFIVLGQ